MQLKLSSSFVAESDEGGKKEHKKPRDKEGFWLLCFLCSCPAKTEIYQIVLILLWHHERIVVRRL